MTQSTFPRAASLLPSIVVGGLAAGTLDAISAFMTFSWRMPYGIASGLLGSKAIAAAASRSPGIWLLGLALHFLIALSAAAIYCAASRRLTCLTRHVVVGSIACGIGVFLVMNLIVLPLSAVPFPVGPFTVQGLRSGLGFHVLLIGLPIAGSLWWFARRAEAGAR